MSPRRRASIAYLAYFTAAGAWWPYLPIFYRNLGLDLPTIGLVVAASAATQVVCSPLWGGLADQFPRSRLTLAAAALTAAGAALGLAGSHELSAVIGWSIVLAAYSGVGPILDARPLEVVGPDRNRYGRVRALGSVAFVLSAWLVGVLVAQRGVTALFDVYVPALILTALVAVTLPHRAAIIRPVSVMRGAERLVRQREMTIFLVGALFVWTMTSAASNFFSIYLVTLGAPVPGRRSRLGVGRDRGSAPDVAFLTLVARFGTERLLVVGAMSFAVRAVVFAVVHEPVALVAANALEGFGFTFFFVGGVMFVAPPGPRRAWLRPPRRSTAAS